MSAGGRPVGRTTRTRRAPSSASRLRRPEVRPGAARHPPGLAPPLAAPRRRAPAAASRADRGRAGLNGAGPSRSEPRPGPSPLPRAFRRPPWCGGATGAAAQQRIAPQILPKSAQPGCGTARSASPGAQPGRSELRRSGSGKGFYQLQEAEGGEGAGRLQESPFPGFPGGWVSCLDLPRAPAEPPTPVQRPLRAAAALSLSPVKPGPAAAMPGY